MRRSSILRQPPSVFLGLLLIIAACGGGSGRDAGLPDTGPPLDGGTRDGGGMDDGGPDAGAADAGAWPDAGPAHDAGPFDGGPDDSLEGTSLEGVALEWDEGPLELCTRWTENESLAFERAMKVHLTLEPRAITSLGRVHLGQTSPSVLLRRGVLREAQWARAPAEIETRVAEWQVQALDRAHALSAKVEHDLGPAGQLAEVYGVYRRAGDEPAAVRLGGQFTEAHFEWSPAGGSERPVLLERCHGVPGLQPAVEVLVGHRGGRAVVVTRFLDTRLAIAGSHPVQLRSALVRFSDRPWESFAVHGFWAQTYSALHHNWEEHSLIDFTRDLGWWHTVFRVHEEGGTPTYPGAVRRVELSGLGAPGVSGTVRVESLDPSTHQPVEESFASSGGWRRVERAVAERALEARCSSGGDVVSLGGLDFNPLDHAFHLLRCPRPGGGRDLVGLLVIAFLHDPEHIGALVDGAAIEPATISGRPGHRVQVGDSTVELTQDPGATAYFLTIRRGTQRITELLVTPSELAPPPADEERLVFVGRGGTPRLEMVRRWFGQGAGHSSIFAPVSFALSFDGQHHRAEAWDDLRYTNTHHNWEDVYEAQSQGLVMRWQTRFLPTRRDVVTVVRESGEVVLPETEVVPE